MNRRNFMKLMVSAAFLAPVAGHALAAAVNSDRVETDQQGFAVTMSDEEWRQKLTPGQYRILRQHGTERAFTSALNKEKRHGSFHCVGCDWLLFLSENKYDSGTGWPSFWKPANEQAVSTSVDNSLLMARTEVHCAHCGGHLGHVFNDGPQPTGLRYCMNGEALKFLPSDS